jgi:hypothetical protein
MKSVAPILVIALSAGALLSCEEEKLPSYVEGWIRCSACTQQFTISGDLDSSKAKYYGYCDKTKSDEFNFVVGSSDLAHVESATDFYISFSGIAGPPTEGAYADPVTEEPKYEPTSFSTAVVKNVNQWGFTQADATTPEQCAVSLFAKPVKGELTPMRETFQFFVKIECLGLNDVLDTNNKGFYLTSVEAELWFDDCD